MLKVTDDGVAIQLAGKSSARLDTVFWLGLGLLGLAVVVAVLMALSSERLAIAALAVLVVGCFVFNRLRQQQKPQSASQTIESGVLWVRSGEFVHELAGKQTHVCVPKSALIETCDDRLSIKDEQGNLCQQIVGFETAKEAVVMRAVLQGESLNKRHANIKMQEG